MMRLAEVITRFQQCTQAVPCSLCEPRRRQWVTCPQPIYPFISPRFDTFVGVAPQLEKCDRQDPAQFLGTAEQLPATHWRRHRSLCQDLMIEQIDEG